MTGRSLPSTTLKTLIVRGRASCDTVDAGRYGCMCHVPIGDADYDMSTDAEYFARTLLRAEPSAADRTVVFSTAQAAMHPGFYEGMIKLVANAGANDRRLTVASLEGHFPTHVLHVGEMLTTVLTNGRWHVSECCDVWTYDAGTNVVTLIPAGASTETNDLRVDGKLTVTGLIDPTGVVLDEQAAAPAPPVAGKGTVWVRDDTPNEFVFTDDAGVDHVLRSGDVVGPAGATDLAVVLYDGATGKLVQDSSLVSDATGSDLTVPGTASLGGTTFPAAPGAVGEVLTMTGVATAGWQTNAGGDVYGPASSTVHAVSRFADATGKVVDECPVPVTLSDAGHLSGLAQLDVAGVTYPTAAGVAGQVLALTGGGTTSTWSPALLGVGSSTDNALMRWDGTSGDTPQDSGVLLDDANNMTGVATIEVAGVTYPTSTGSAGQVLALTGTGTTSTWLTPPWGDVSRSGATFDERLARWDGTTATIQNSIVALNDAGDMSGVRGFAADGGTVSLNQHAWPAAAGSAGYVLTTSGPTPATLAWTDPATGYLWQTTTESAFTVLRPQGAGATNTLCFGAVTPYDAGTGARMWFDATKAAFRAGNTSAASWWQLANVGQNSVALGSNVQASGASSVCFGVGNYATGAQSTVGGGGAHTASADQTTIGGGTTNTASAQGATVGGGGDNQATGAQSTVGGGRFNLASGTYAVVGGGGGPVVGDRNTASGSNSFVGGGQNNAASAAHATVAGGRDNVASGAYAAIGGGQTNSATRQYNTVAGGTGNSAIGEQCAVGGGGGNTAGTDASTVYATVAGGRDNAATVSYATVGGGRDNQATGDYATVGGGGGSGVGNAASGDAATVGGGLDNSASGNRATIGGGQENSATNDHDTVGGGLNNSASGNYSTVGGGQNNAVPSSGTGATIPGGRNNTAGGDDSFVCGASGSDGNFDNCFVFADGNATVADSANRVFFRSAQGCRWYTTAAGTGTGVQLGNGSTSWSSISDRDAKRDIEEVDYDAIARRVDDGVKVYTYRMRDQPDENATRHVGTMAQEFAAVVDTGKSDRLIDRGDASGVNLALCIATRRQQRADRDRIAALEAENAALKERLARVEAALGI